MPSTPPSTTRLICYTLDELRSASFPERRPLILDGEAVVFRESNLGMIHAPRGTGKTWEAQAIALMVASGGTHLRWRAPEARGVLYVDGEMPADLLQFRFGKLADALGLRNCSNLKIVAADWQRDPLPRLDSPEGRALIEPFITSDLGLVVLDNTATLFDIAAETDPEAWQPAQGWLLSLRRRGTAAITVHHSNRQGGSRGHSHREDVLDLIVKLSRPLDYEASQGCRFKLELEKARSLFGQAAEPLVARLDENSHTWALECTDSPRSRQSSIRAAILVFVGERPGCTKNAVVENIPFRGQDVRKTLDAMAEAGDLRKADGRWWVAR